MKKDNNDPIYSFEKDQPLCLRLNGAKMIINEKFLEAHDTVPYVRFVSNKNPEKI